MNLYLVLKLKKDLFLDMNRYQILIEYVGTNFIGWQIQPKGKSIQKIIQLKISKLLKEKIKLVGSGRTDTGVHASLDLRTLSLAKDAIFDKIIGFIDDVKIPDV